MHSKEKKKDQAVKKHEAKINTSHFYAEIIKSAEMMSLKIDSTNLNENQTLKEKCLKS